MTIIAPKNDRELRQDIEFAFDYQGPIAVRYPRGTAYTELSEFNEPIVFGKSEMLYEENDIAILAVGSMVSTGQHVREKLKAEGHSCTLVNMRFIKPVDTGVLDRIAKNHSLVITMEENVLNGGMGLTVSDYMNEHYPEIKIMHVAIPDGYVEHGDVSKLRRELGIDSDSILDRLRDRL